MKALNARPSSDRANALRDAVCQIFSATGAYGHDIPRLCKEALERDNRFLDGEASARPPQPKIGESMGLSGNIIVTGECQHPQLAFMNTTGGAVCVTCPAVFAADSPEGKRAEAAWKGGEASARPSPLHTAALAEHALAVVRHWRLSKAGDFDGTYNVFCDLLENLERAAQGESARLSPIPHRCSGCGHRWDGLLTGVELCGDCWRKGQGVILGGPAAAQEPEIPERRPDVGPR